MKRGIMRWAASLLVLMVLLGGCSAKGKDSESANVAPEYDTAIREQPEQQAAPTEVSDGKAETEVNTTFDQAITGSNNANASTINNETPNPILDQRKVIRNAYVQVEVDEFDTAYTKLKSLINGIGFVQESKIKKEKYYTNGVEKYTTRGTIVIRIDKDRFDTVLGDVKGLGTAVDENISTDDVTSKFFDVESQLRALKYEQQKLEQYLLKLEDIDKIFRTETRLTEIRHQIESLTGTLNKWNDLVALSTITIDIREKAAQEPAPVVKEKTYWEKMEIGFTGSTKGVFVFCGNVLLFLVQALPVLVLLALLGIPVLLIYKRILQRRNDTRHDA